ncbi:hypothetical protein D3C77_289060 [compost metagenome]
MNLDPRSKWISRIEIALLIAFALVIAVNAWVAIDKYKLNKRYEQSIEQLESFVQGLI